MYSTQKAKNKKNPITLDYILSRITEYDIYERYLGKFKVGFIYNSPFRKDKNPSFGVFKSKKTGSLLFKDHGNGECGDVIKFASLYTGISDYNKLLEKIVEDLKIKNTTTLKNVKEEEFNETIIGVVRQPWTKVDATYWKQFHISRKTLEKFDVNSIKYYLCNGIVKGIYKDTNPMYCYKVNDRFKIYRPYADKYTKWRNNLTEDDIQGHKQISLLQQKDVLFITKSLKDVMCLYEMGYTAISPSSESTFIPNKYIEDYKKIYKHIIILFDRDIAGMKNTRKIVNKTKLDFIFMHKKFKGKDVSDCIRNTSFEEVKEWITKQTKKYENSLESIA